MLQAWSLFALFVTSAVISRLSDAASLQQLMPPDLADGSTLGRSVAVDEDWAIVGAPFAPVMGIPARGRALVFRRDGTAWSYAADLPVVDVAGACFGLALSIEGDLAAVAAPGCDPDAQGPASPPTGSVRLYRLAQTGDWLLESVIAGQSIRFGFDVDIDPAAGRVVVGSPDEDSAYVYEHGAGQWTLADTIHAGADGSLFGLAVAISGDHVLGGAPLHGGLGAAYSFTRDGSGQYILDGPLQVPQPRAAGEWFGWSLAIDGERALVGTPYGATSANMAAFEGVAHLYALEASAWVHSTRLISPDALNGDRFGWSVALSATNALVGAPSKDWCATCGNAADEGAAYVFTVGTRGAEYVATYVGSQLFAEFGNSVDIDASSLVVGAHRAYPNVEDPNYTADAGAAFVLAEANDIFSDGFE